MKNLILAKKLIEENKTEKYVDKKYKNNLELISLYKALKSDEVYKEILNSADKNNYTNRDLLELINDYGDFPEYLFLFCKKNNLIAANTLYNKNMKDSAQEIIEFSKSNSEYCRNLVDATVFSEKIKTKTIMKIAGNSLEEFLEYIKDHISNFNGIEDDELSSKMIFFKLNLFVNNKNLDPIKKSIEEIIKNEKEVIKHLKTSEYVNQDALFFDIFPKVINFDVNYKLNKKSISFNIINSPFKTKLIDKIKNEKEFLDNHKKETTKRNARMGLTIAKFAAKILIPGSSIVTEGMEIVDNIKDSIELGSDLSSTLQPNQISKIKKDFIESGFPLFKEYFYNEVQKEWKSYLKESDFKIDIDIDIPTKTLYNMYETFINNQLLKNINQKSTTIIEQSKNVVDLGAYYLDVIDNQNNGDSEDLMM